LSPRSKNRRPDQLRPARIQRDFPSQAPGSYLIEAGRTVILCTASFTETVPGWLNGAGHGWVTAEYSMLPASTQRRKNRDIRQGRQDGRSVEIQRLIGRSLRNAVDIPSLPEVSIWIDCDVLSADGGTRTWAITGAWLALHDCLLHLKKKGRLSTWPMKTGIAATSVGKVGGEFLLDLDYSEDSRAEVDMNVVMTGEGEFAEVQLSGERSPLSRGDLDRMLDLAAKGCRELLDLQEEFVGEKA